MSEKQVTIKLQQPIVFGSETIFELTLHPPKAKHLRGLSLNMNMDDMFNLAGKLSGQPNSVIDELSITDMQTVTQAISNFLDNGLLIGKTS